MKQLSDVICGAALFLGGMIGLSACLITNAADLMWIISGILALAGLVYMIASCSGTKKLLKWIFFPPKEEKRDEK